MASLVCTYASKPCNEPRAVKENGELHRLCESHRDKANEAQRRWHARHQSVKRARPSLSQMGSHHRRASEPMATDTIQWALPPARRHLSMTQEVDVVELAHLALYTPPPLATSPPTSPSYHASFLPPPATSEGGALSADDLALLSAILVDDADDDFVAKPNTEEYQFIV